MNNVVSQAFLNVFVHSKRYLRSTDMQLPKNLRFIDIEIGKVLQGSQHKKNFETFRNLSVPDGGNDGDFVQLNVTQMVAEWFLSEETSHGMVIKITASKSGAPLPHKIVSLDAENFATVSSNVNSPLSLYFFSRKNLLNNILRYDKERTLADNECAHFSTKRKLTIFESDTHLNKKV
jgi:hypothetical protein